MNKKYLVVMGLMILFGILAFVNASTFEDLIQGDFNNGTFFQTFYNSSGFVQLNATNTTGNFTSQIFNAGGNSQWNNISWVSSAIGELPANQLVETSFGSGNVNMTGNVLLMHFNNDSAYGENDTHVYDFSGNGNNGTVYNAIWNSSGKLSGGMEFDGDDDWVDLGDYDYSGDFADTGLGEWGEVGVSRLDTGGLTFDPWSLEASRTDKLNPFKDKEDLLYFDDLGLAYIDTRHAKPGGTGPHDLAQRGWYGLSSDGTVDYDNYYGSRDSILETELERQEAPDWVDEFVETEGDYAWNDLRGLLVGEDESITPEEYVQ